MNNKEYNVDYKKTAIEMAEFVEEKDTLYGHALFNMLDEYGMDYALSKLTEKLFRLKQLKKLGREDHSESFIDSLKDIWGYSFLTILYLEQVQNNRRTEISSENETNDFYDFDKYASNTLSKLENIIKNITSSIQEEYKKDAISNVEALSQIGKDVESMIPFLIYNFDNSDEDAEVDDIDEDDNSESESPHMDFGCLDKCIEEMVQASSEIINKYYKK